MYLVSHADRIFYFYVVDENNKELKTFVMPMVDKVSKLKGKTTIPEQYNYKFEKPGHYKVWAIGEFSVGNETKQYQLETEVMNIEVKGS